jgi:hypothetical protein
MASTPRLGLRRGIVLGASLAVPIALVFGLGHRGVHMMRSMVVPGAGLVGSDNLLAAACLLAAVGATVAWVRWGMDWLLAAVVVGAVVASGLVSDSHAAVTTSMASIGSVARPVVASHEFPLVLLAAGLISWLRTVVGRIPGLSHLARRRGRTSEGLASVDRLRPVDRSRTAAVVALAGDTELAGVIATDPAIEQRARRVGTWARFRFGGDSFRVDHAPARAALTLAGSGDEQLTTGFVGDAERTTLGVPCSEPTWVRPLDGTLAAIALHHCGGSADRWVTSLRREFGLHRGHRAAWYWTPLGWPAGSAPAWEHATSTALARAMGWIGDDDWPALRARALGASARGTEHPHDERLIAAARIWLVFVDDQRAAPLLARPTVQHDPLAVALDRVAIRLTADSQALANVSHAADAVTHPEVHA